MKKTLTTERTKRTLCIALAVLLFAAAVSSTSVFAATQNEAATTISSAKNELLNRYNAAKDAEAAGANITTLQTTFNTAGALLSHAELSYANNDFEAALAYATQCQNALVNFVSEANALKTAGSQQASQSFLFNVILPAVGALVVVGAGTATWFWLQRRYEKNGVCERGP